MVLLEIKNKLFNHKTLKIPPNYHKQKHINITDHTFVYIKHKNQDIHISIKQKNQYLL